MSIEEEIYAELVKRFGVGEICIKPFTRTNRKSKTWLEFIHAVLTLETKELPIFCGFNNREGFSSYFNTHYRDIMLVKNGRHWASFLLNLLNIKRCSCCNTLKVLSEFNVGSVTSDGLQYTCRDCEKEYYRSNSAHILSNKKKYYIINKENTQIRSKTYYINNVDSILEYHKNRYYNNKAYYFAKAAKYRASKLHATPKWADQVVIKEIYQTCPEGYHVDHIIPLQNDLVCGLHCEFNLQHLSAHDNLSKGNKYEP